jgi:hypothetical protein
LPACSAVSVLHTRLRRRVASSSAVGFPSRGGRSRGRFRGEMPGFFALAAEEPILRPARPRRMAGPEAGSSLRPSAGGANEEAAPRARECRPAMPAGSLLTAVPASPGQSPELPRAGLAPAGSRTPRAFHGLDFGSIVVQRDQSREPPPSGPAPALRPLHARAPLLRGGTTIGPVRAPGLLLRSTSRPREALRLSSVVTPRCLETVSTTDVSRHEHPLTEHHLRRLSAGLAVGKPASSSTSRTPSDVWRFRLVVLGRRRTTSRSSGLRQPRA